MQAPFADPLLGLERLRTSLPLVGRDRELHAIHSLLDTVALHLPTGARALTISGEMGVGKTRLLAQMCLAARERGFRVLEAHAYESGSTFPYFPFIEALLASSPPGPVLLLGHGGTFHCMLPIILSNITFRQPFECVVVLNVLTVFTDDLCQVHIALFSKVFS